MSGITQGFRVDGRHLVSRQTGEPVLLRGVNRSGMEYCPAGCGGMTRDELAFLRACGANVLRVPFNQDWVLRRSGYLEQLEQVCDWCQELELAVILDLQWLDDHTRHGAGNRVPCIPSLETPEMWRIVARRYRGRAPVLFDIFNEPHDRLTGDEQPFLRPDGRPYEEQQNLTSAIWNEWALHLVDAIHGEDPDRALLVSGTDWGYDLRGFPLLHPGLVYSTHVYRSRGEQWEECFGSLARTACVFAGEWGGEAQDLSWGTRLADYFDELGIGWTAWSWSDRPRLWSQGRATAFGKIVLDRLSV